MYFFQIMHRGETKLNRNVSGYIQGIIFSSLFVFSLPIASLAQGIVSMDTNMSIEFNPRNPGPNQSVEARAVTFSFNKMLADFSWYLDGKLLASGIGKQTAVFNTGGPGSQHIVELTVKTSEGKTVTAYVELTIGDIDLIWSAETTVPPGYQGRALPSTYSVLRVVAQPNFITNGRQIDPNILSYEWFLDGKRLPNNSGTGRDTLALNINTSPNVEMNVTVNISTVNQTIKQSKSLYIRPTAPKINFYEIDPARGPQYHQSLLKGMSLAAGTETKILAVPYFFNQRSFGGLDYIWKVRGQKISEPNTRPAILSFTANPGSFGMQHVSLHLENPASPLEIADQSFVIHVK